MPIGGTYVYTPALGTILNAGMAQTLSVTFTPTDSSNYNTATTTVKIDILNQNDPVITWPTPANIVFGMKLSAEQLNATSSAPGTFVYTPALGTVLNAGSDQLLSVTFTPDDTTQFNTITKTATINVLALSMDFGDGPSQTQSGYSADYPVTVNQDGARHVVGSLFLGTIVEPEIDGSSSVSAEGDADDDGVVFLADPVAVVGTSTTASVRVHSSGAGMVDAWFDFNRDGDWNDSGEKIISGAAVGSGDTMLSYQVPAGASPGSSYARFRLSTLGSALPTGEAADGEVEDYHVGLISGETVPTVKIQSISSDNVLHLGLDLVTLVSGTMTQFEAPNDQVGTFDYHPLATPESINVVLTDHRAVAADRIQFRAFADGSRLKIRGPGGSIDLTNVATQAAHGRVTLDLNDDDANSATINAALAQKWSSATLPMRVIIGSNDRLLFTDATEWRMTGPVTTASIFQLTAATRTGDVAIIVSAVQPWQNFIRLNDVNNDGLVLASDALRIINELNEPKFSDLNGLLVDPSSLTGNPNSYYDTNGDGLVTPLDALRVINELNSQPIGAEPLEIAEQGSQLAAPVVASAGAWYVPISSGESMPTREKVSVDPRLDDPSAMSKDSVTSQPLPTGLPSASTAEESSVDEKLRAVDELFAQEAFVNLGAF